MGILASLVSLFADPWTVVENWRKRRDSVVVHQKPTYDSYPDRDIPPPIRLYVEARDVRGRLLREYVDLEGYSLHQINFRPGQRRGNTTVWAWFIGQTLEAVIHLSARLDQERERKERT